MSQKLAIHKNKEHPTDALWWKPFFDMQKEMNRNMQKMMPGFMPLSFWNEEENAFEVFQKNIHSLYSQMFNNRQMLTPWWLGNHTEPYVDIIENKNSFTIKADVPGVEASNLDVSVSEKALIIEGDRQDCQEDEGDNYIRRECCSGSFSRTIALPEDADLDNATAIFERNVLLVEIPKKEGAAPVKTRKLKIAANEQKKAA